MEQTLSKTRRSLLSSILVLNDVSWQTYDRLLDLLGDRGDVRLTYDRGTLEMMSSLPEHETYSWTIGRLVVILSEELGLEIRGLKSTTWRSQVQAAGKEADECFYIQNEPRVRNKLNIDLSVDPPPDLAIEIDVTHSAIDKLGIYARLQVPEVWRWQAGKLTIYILENQAYRESDTSLAFATFPVKEIEPFVRFDPQQGENARMRSFRDWVRSRYNG